MDNNQKQWRREKRQARKALDNTTRQTKSQTVCKQVIESDAYLQATCIGAYLAMPEEINVKAIIEHAWANGKSVFLPVVLDWGVPLKFAPYTPDTLLTQDCLGIDIPNVGSEHYIDATELDVVVTPLVAFDEHRNRIGMGGGFYDRTFACKKTKATPHLIGVAFDVQQVDGNITANEWDIRPDAIVSG